MVNNLNQFNCEISNKRWKFLDTNLIINKRNKGFLYKKVRLIEHDFS